MIIIIEIKHIINVMCLNHPETISPAPTCGKTVFHETVPGAKRLGMVALKESDLAIISLPSCLIQLPCSCFLLPIAPQSPFFTARLVVAQFINH